MSYKSKAKAIQRAKQVRAQYENLRLLLEQNDLYLAVQCAKCLNEGLSYLRSMIDKEFPDLKQELQLIMMFE